MKMTIEMDVKRGTVRISFAGVDPNAIAQPAAWPCIEGVHFGPFEGVVDCDDDKKKTADDLHAAAGCGLKRSASRETPEQSPRAREDERVVEVPAPR